MRKQLKEFIIGGIIVSLASFAGYFIGPIEVRYISSLTDNPTLVGATYAIGTIFLAILGLWLGRLSDSFGRNNFLVVGCALGVIYPLLYANTYNVFQYMGVKFIWAFSAVATGPIFMAYLQDLLKGFKNKGQMIGILYSVQSITGAVAAFIGGYLSDAYGITTPYIAMSAVFFLAAIISFYHLGFSKKIPTKKKQEKRDMLFGVRYLFARPELVLYLVHNVATSLSWGSKAILWPLIIFAMTGKDIITGSIFATMGVVAFMVLLFIGKVVDKIGPFIGSNIALLILSVTGFFLAFASNVYIFWVAAGIYAIGEALSGPSKAVMLTDNIESKYRGEILGVDSLFNKIFNTVSPFMAGLMLSIWEAQEVLLVYVIINLIAFLINSGIKKQISLKSA